MDLYSSWLIFMQLYFWPMLGVIGLAVGAQALRRLVRAQERKAANLDSFSDLQARLEQTESLLEQNQKDIARLDDAQAFTTRLLRGQIAEKSPRDVD